MQMESNQLLHEMFHAYQSYQTVLSDYDAIGQNREIEAHYAQYLYVSKLPEYQSSSNKWKRRYSNNLRYTITRRLEEFIDNKGNLRTTTNNDLLDLFIYSTVNPVFRDNGYPENKYPYKENYNLLDNFSNIKKLTKGC